MLSRDAGRLSVSVATDGSARQVRGLLDEIDPGHRAVRRFAVHVATLDDVFLALLDRPPDEYRQRAGACRDHCQANDCHRRNDDDRAQPRLSRRNLDVLLMSLMLPVILYADVRLPVRWRHRHWYRVRLDVVPGVLVLCAGFGSATTAVNVSQDMTNGVMDRFRSLDVSGAAVLSGHVAASVVRNTASTVLVFGIALPHRIPFRRRTFSAGSRPVRCY